MKTFKKILTIEAAAKLDAVQQAAVDRQVKINAAKYETPVGAYQKAINKQIEKTGKTRAVKVPRSAKTLAPPYGSTTLYKDSQIPGKWKLWTIWTEGNEVVTEWGRVGDDLMHKAKAHTSEAAAIRQMEKTIRVKRLEGYRNRP